MERFLLYLDDLDDLYGMIGLIGERLRRLMFVALAYLLLCSGALMGIWLALTNPPVALAISIILFVTLLYRSVTSPANTRAQRPWPTPPEKPLKP
jgi:hypothetical protein